MKKILYTGSIVFALGLFLLISNTDMFPDAQAAGAGEHAGHDHAAVGHDDHGNDLESLFGESEHGHDDHAEEAHAGHSEAGHDDHGAKSSDPHAGHGHKDEHGHGHGADGICPEHKVPEAIDALCQAGHIGDLRPGQGMKVRLASPDVAAKAGVRTTSPQQVVLAQGSSLHGRTIFDREKLAHVTPLANGVVRSVNAKPGDSVEKGDVLVELAMPELANITADFVTSLAQREQFRATFERERDLLERGITSRREFQQAEADYRGIQSKVDKFRNQLLNYGLRPADLEAIVQTRDIGAVVALRAPFGGVVTDLQTAVGEAVNSGKTLVTIADLDSLWVELAIPESLIYRAEVGATIQAQFKGLPGHLFSGELFQVGAIVDERTRTLTALAEVANPGHYLKTGMFGNVQILAGEATAQLAIPADAVQNIDGLPYIFVQDNDDLFELRRVTTGPNQGGLMAIVAGLGPDDLVVYGQGFALKSEVLKARLGASCADH
ncbi:MAG: hypothetical protein C0616_00975 [Desulfuromonas sp.]|nr:MAG: hypothetical protein C0616_00975 [Desulfuromonas sp.]